MTVDIAEIAEIIHNSRVGQGSPFDESSYLEESPFPLDETYSSSGADRPLDDGSDFDEATTSAEAGGPEPFEGITHAQALATTLPEDRYLIDDFMPAGTVGVVAGVPETYKSFVAQAIGTRTAAGTGSVLDRPVLRQVRVGYFWQDDSTREELERIKLFEAVHASPDKLPLTWFLNVGLQLPRDIGRLRATVDSLRLELVVLDSYYNIAAVDLKDEGAEQIIAQLKREICHTTGCTVLIVDHMPWATDSNRQRLRTYGGVFKNAATRFGIYIDAIGDKLFIEARGNNIRGFKRTPAVWDAETLELRLIDVAKVDTQDRDEHVLAYVTDHPGDPQKYIEEGVEGGRESIRQSLERLASHELIARGPGRHSRGKYWYPANHAGLQSPGDTQATLGDMAPEQSQAHVSPQSPPPFKGATDLATPCVADKQTREIAHMAETFAGAFDEPEETT